MGTFKPQMGMTADPYYYLTKSASEEDDIFFVELRKQILLLTSEEDDENEYSSKNRSSGCDGSIRQGVSHACSGKIAPGSYFSLFNNSGDGDSSVPIRLLSSWRHGGSNGTGVFIPRHADSRIRYKQGRTKSHKSSNPPANAGREE